MGVRLVGPVAPSTTACGKKSPCQIGKSVNSHDMFLRNVTRISLVLRTICVLALLIAGPGALAAAPRDRETDNKDEEEAPVVGPPKEMKMGIGYFRARGMSMDSSTVEAGFQFLNARLLNSFVASRSAMVWPYSVPHVWAGGGEVGLSAMSEDGMRGIHMHLAYYKAGSAAQEYLGQSYSNKLYLSPVAATVYNAESSYSGLDRVSQEGLEAEMLREFFFLRATDNPYFRYFALRAGLGLSTDRARMRGAKISSVTTLANGVATDTDYYPGALPSGSALRQLQMDYRQTNLYLLVGFEYRAPIGKRHEVSLAVDAFAVGASGGYFTYTELLVPTIPPNAANPISLMNYGSAISGGNTLEGPVAGVLNGQRVRGSYTFKFKNDMALNLGVGETVKSFTLYTPKIKASGTDQASSLLAGDTQEYLMKSAKSLGVSKVKIMDRRREISLEIQSRF